jgi:hypothetical protein
MSENVLYHIVFLTAFMAVGEQIKDNEIDVAHGTYEKVEDCEG